MWTRTLVYPAKYDCLNLYFILETVVVFLLVSLSTSFAYFEDFINLCIETNKVVSKRIFWQIKFLYKRIKWCCHVYCWSVTKLWLIFGRWISLLDWPEAEVISFWINLWRYLLKEPRWTNLRTVGVPRSESRLFCIYPKTYQLRQWPEQIFFSRFLFRFW